jgi:hypothetical protein
MKLTHNILLVSFVPALLQAANLKRFNPGYCYRQKDQLARPTNLNRMHRYRFNGEHGADARVQSNRDNPQPLGSKQGLHRNPDRCLSLIGPDAALGE